jgi:hypothetical protein
MAELFQMRIEDIFRRDGKNGEEAAPK